MKIINWYNSLRIRYRIFTEAIIGIWLIAAIFYFLNPCIGVPALMTVILLFALRAIDLDEENDRS